MPGTNEDVSISFVIPVLNGGKFIRQCLEHIFLESQPDDEVIVVDNGSTDDTVAIVESFSRARIITFPDHTISAVRNHGAAATKGELLAFIDADCMICQNWRRSVLSVMSDPDVSATGSTYVIPDPATWIEKAWYSQRSSEVRPVKYINSGNLIVRRSAFEKVSGFDESLITDEDYDLGQRLNRADMVVLSAPQIRSIHLGNPKTLGQFYGKQKWHATSSLKTQSWRQPDKPTIMTILFILGLILSVCSVPLAILGNPLFLASLSIVPLILLATVLFRLIQYKGLRYFFELHILYFMFYTARSAIIMEALLRRKPG